MMIHKKIRNYFLPHKASTPDEFIISALLNGVLLGIGLAVGNALALIIEKKYFPELAQATQQAAPKIEQHDPNRLP